MTQSRSKPISSSIHNMIYTMCVSRDLSARVNRVTCWSGWPLNALFAYEWAQHARLAGVRVDVYREGTPSPARFPASFSNGKTLGGPSPCLVLYFVCIISLTKGYNMCIYIWHRRARTHTHTLKYIHSARSKSIIKMKKRSCSQWRWIY